MKIILLIIGSVLVLGTASYFIFVFDFDKEANEMAFMNTEEFILPGVDLYFSVLDEASLPAIEFEDGLGFEPPEIKLAGVGDLGATPVPEISFNASVFDVSFPQLNISLPAQDSGFSAIQVEQEASQTAVAEAAAQAEAEARAEAEVEARAEAGAPAPKETTTPPSTQETAPPTQTGPSTADCAQFDSAPSCDYVPVNVRDICLQCKAQ